MLVLAIVSLEIPLGLSLRDRVDSEVRSQARAEADVVAATAADLMTPGRRSELRRLTATAARSTRGRVVIVDQRARLVADSGPQAALGADYSSRPEVAAALRGRSTQERRYSRTLDKDLLATAVPVVSGGRPAGAVRVTQGVDAVSRSVRRSIVGLVLIGLAVLLTGLLAGAFIARQMARPLRRLQAAAERVSGGQLETRATLEGSSEQRALAAAFNEMTDRLERLVRSHQDFVADASHQLRTPLTGVRLRLEEVEASSSLEEALEEVDKALAEVDRLSGVVDELLVLSRAGERDGEPGRVSLAEAAARAAERWRHAAEEKDVELSVRLEEPGVALCPPADLDRALDALIENAVRYSAAGSGVQVTARSDRIRVLDRGPGLEEGEEEQVFERFHRGTAGRQGEPGTGLGLAIAAALARAWGGQATISNRPGGGACAELTFYRPLTPSAPTPDIPRTTVGSG